MLVDKLLAWAPRALIAVLVALPIMGTASAADPSSPASPPAAQTDIADGGIVPFPQGARLGDLARIQEERLLTKARLDLLSMKGQLKAEEEKHGQVEQSYTPTVKAVLGAGDVLYATFAYPGNMTMDAKVGDVITGGYVVDSIGVDQVTLSRGAEKFRLGFSASPPTPLSSQASQASIFPTSGLMPAGIPR